MMINTDQFSRTLRSRGVDPASRGVLISRLSGSRQEEDIREPVNCEGLGRLRRFRRVRDTGWPSNPLPIDPAARALGLDVDSTIRAQVFQNAICNWRCWYCFVPFELLKGDPALSEMVSVERLVDLYMAQQDRPPVIDLSGGQPDLVPEWIPWMMRELQSRQLERRTYLWSDDNLSNDYFWRYLSDDDLEVVAGYPSYGRVCCFKGFDETSFSFNTSADPSLFDRQFELMERLLSLGIDLYAYVTLTTPTADDIDGAMERFVDRLQDLSTMLPLRTVPLKIEMFSPVIDRMNRAKEQAIELQWKAVRAWEREIEKRFTDAERAVSVVNHSVGDHTR